MSRVLLLGFMHPIAVLVSALVITLAAWPYAWKVHLDVSADLLIAPGSTEQRTYDAVRSRFGEDETAVVYVEDDGLFTPARLARLRSLHDALSSLPFVTRVESLCSILDLREIDGAIELAPLVGPDAPRTPEEAAAIREQVLKHPILQKNVVSVDGTATLLTLHLREEAALAGESEMHSRREREIGAALTPFTRDFRAVFQLGAPTVQAAIVEALRSDLAWLLPLACGILFIVLTVTLRSVLAAALPIVLAAVAVCWMLAVMAVLGLPLTLLNSMLPILMLVIGAAEDIHLYHEFIASIRHEADRLTAFHATARRIGLAMALTTSTTLLGFASTALTDMPIVRNFGLCAVIGLSARFVLSLILLPALLRLLSPHFAKVARRGAEQTGTAGLAKWIVAHLVPRARWVTAGLALLSGAAIAAAWRIEPSNDLLSYLGRDSAVVRHTEHAATKLAGLNTISLEITGKPESFLQPRELMRLRELCGKIAALPGVDAVTSFADAVARMHQQLHGGAADEFRVPDSTSGIRQMLLFVDAAEFSGLITPDYSAVHVRIRTPIGNSAEFNRLVGRIRELVAASDFAAQPFTLTGGSVVVAAAVDSITAAQVSSLGATTVVMFAIVALLFLSARCGAINLVVNLFAIVVCFGVMGMAGVPLNAGTCMVAAITLGIAVDDTIHLLVRFNREVRRLKDERRGIEAALRSEIRPIIATTLAVAGGFVVLAFSSLEPVRQFGALSAGVLFLAMLTDLVVTPVFFANTRLVTLWDVLGLNVRRSLLEHSSFFRGLNSWQARRVILVSNVEKYAEGDFIVRDGDMGHTMYVIISGECEVWVEQGGARRTLARLGAGEPFGEVALVSARPRTANITALTATSVLVLDQAALRSLSRLSPYLSSRLFLNIANILGQRLANVIDQRATTPPVKT